MVFICVSLTANDAEPSVRAICVSYLEISPLPILNLGCLSLCS